MKSFLILLIALSTGSSYAQQLIKKSVLKNTHPISAIDPTNKNYTDLKQIGAAIGESTIVMLGEQDHGDAPTFLAKTRLIEYLIAEKGFTVVAFESDFYSLNNGWNSVVENKDSIRGFLNDNIFGIWTNCKQCDPLFNYLSENVLKKKLEVTGFDSQHHGKYYKQNYYTPLFKFLDTSRILPKQSLDEQMLSTKWNQFYSFRNKNLRVPDSVWNYLISSFDQLSKQAITKYGTQNFWGQDLKSIHAYYEQMYTYERGIGYKGESIRDLQMADNINWLATEKFKGKKIIVWAANLHIGKKATAARVNRKFKFEPMGQALSKTMGNTVVYSLGFTSLQGTAGRLGMKHYKLPAAKNNSIESWIESMKYDYAFIDLKQIGNKEKPFNMKGDTFHKNAKAEWANFYDGIFYIKEMLPCEPLAR